MTSRLENPYIINSRKLKPLTTEHLQIEGDLKRFFNKVLIRPIKLHSELNLSSKLIQITALLQILKGDQRD